MFDIAVFRVSTSFDKVALASALNGRLVLITSLIGVEFDPGLYATFKWGKLCGSPFNLFTCSLFNIFSKPSSTCFFIWLFNDSKCPLTFFAFLINWLVDIKAPLILLHLGLHVLIILSLSQNLTLYLILNFPLPNSICSRSRVIFNIANS